MNRTNQPPISRRLCLAVSVLICSLAIGCGGDVRRGYPVYVRGLAATDVAAVATQRQDELSGSGVILPVGIRRLDDSLVVVDVLVALPNDLPRSFPPETYMESVFNHLAVFNAADGKGFALRRCDGRPVPLGTIDLNDRSHATIASREVLLSGFTTNPIVTEAGGKRFHASVLPIPLRCRDQIEVGSCILIRTDVREYFGLRVAREEQRMTVRPFP